MCHELYSLLSIVDLGKVLLELIEAAVSFLMILCLLRINRLSLFEHEAYL